jgi:hypothetical protein
MLALPPAFLADNLAHLKESPMNDKYSSVPASITLGSRPQPSEHAAGRRSRERPGRARAFAAIVALGSCAIACESAAPSEADGTTAAAQMASDPVSNSTARDYPLGTFQLTPTVKTHSMPFSINNALMTSFFVVVTADRKDIQFSGELVDCRGNRTGTNVASYGQQLTLYRPLAAFNDNSCTSFTVNISALWLPGATTLQLGTANFTAKLVYSAGQTAGGGVDSQCWGLPTDRWACGSGQSNSRPDWAYLCQKNQFGNVVPLITQCQYGCENDTCVLKPQTEATAPAPGCNCRGFDDASSTTECGARLCAGDGKDGSAIWVCGGAAYQQTSEPCTP